MAKVTKPRLLFFPSRARNQGRGWVTRILGRLTFEDEALLDGPQLREEVLQLRPARLQGQVGHLCTADVAQLGPSTVQTGGCGGKGSNTGRKIEFFPQDIVHKGDVVNLLLLPHNLKLFLPLQ